MAPEKPGSNQLAGLPPYRGGKVSAFSSLRAAAEREASLGGPLGLERAATPVMLGGFTDSIAQMLAKELEPLGEEDLALMRPHWKALRIYGASGFAGTLLEEIRAER